MIIFNTGVPLPQEIIRISSNGNIGIGTFSPSLQLSTLNEWAEILKLSETNTAVAEALEQLRIIYILAKNNKDDI